jgi:membrane fusion protein (multidrug efflux system)
MRLEGLGQQKAVESRPRRFAWNKIFLVFGVSLALLAGIAFWRIQAANQSTAGTASQSTAQAPGGIATPRAADRSAGSVPEVQVMKPIRRDVVQTLRLSATVSPYYQTTLYSKVSGYLKRIAVDKGDIVKAGQILAVIDDPELLERYHQAQSEFQIKKVTYERLANVRKENADVIAKQDVDVAEANYQGAKHALDQLASMLDYTKVRAPYSGTVTARFVDPGALIQAATSSATQAVPLFTIMDISKLRFYINVPQEDAPFVKKGTPVTIAVSDVPGKILKATVTRSTVALDPGTRSLLAEVEVPNPGQSLAPGMFAEVVVELRRHPEALVVPPAALVSEGASKAVFSVDQGTARKIPVQTGIDDGLWVEIISGLTGTEDIVVTGKARVSDGARVKAFPYSLPEGTPASQRF